MIQTDTQIINIDDLIEKEKIENVQDQDERADDVGRDL